MKFCNLSKDQTVDRYVLEKSILEGPRDFAPEQVNLATAFSKIRAALYGNLAEQFNSFKFMPQSYTLSFTDELFKDVSHLPTSTLYPELGDGKYYYKNLFPPVANTSSAQSTSQKVALF